MLEYRKSSIIQPNKNWKRLADLESWETSHHVTDLKAGEKYEFRIMSKGKGPRSESMDKSTRFANLRDSYGLAGVLSEPVYSEPFEMPSHSSKL